MKEVARKKVECLQKFLPKRVKAPLPELIPLRALGEGSSISGGVAHQGTTADAFAEVRLWNIMEYKAS